MLLIFLGTKMIFQLQMKWQVEWGWLFDSDTQPDGIHISSLNIKMRTHFKKVFHFSSGHLSIEYYFRCIFHPLKSWCFYFISWFMNFLTGGRPPPPEAQGGRGPQTPPCDPPQYTKGLLGNHSTLIAQIANLNVIRPTQYT